MKYYNSLEILESRIAPAVLIVTSSVDSSTATAGDGTLRGEILASNAAHGVVDTIEFAHGVSNITLTGGALDITHTVHIAGPGASKLTISGGDASGIFNVSGHAAGTVFAGMTLQDGAAGGPGGAIDSTVTITVKNSTLQNNSATYGGAIAVGPAQQNFTGTPVLPHASLLLENTLLTGNTATSGGGGVYMAGVSGSATILNSKFLENSTTGAGGAVNVQGINNFVLSKSSISGHADGTPMTNANYGGGLVVGAHNISIANSYIGGNRAQVIGGAILRGSGSGSSIVISGSSIDANNTLAPNQNGYGPVGGLVIESSPAAHQTLITNTKIVGNVSNTFAGGLFLEGGNTLMTTDTVSNNITSGAGGGIAVDGGLTMVSCGVDGNSVTVGASNSDFPFSGGGGIAIFEAVPVTLIDTHVRNNTATDTTAMGGGILQVAGGNLSIINSAILSNSTGAQGGGIAVAGTEFLAVKPALAHTAAEVPPTLPPPSTSHLLVVNTHVSGNQGGVGAMPGSSTTNAGGFYISGNTSVNIQQSAFLGNASTSGTGGGYLNTTGPAHFTNVSFNANTGSLDGGLTVESVGADTTFTMIDGRFAHNQGETGGLHIASGVKGLVQDSVIIQNVSNGDAFAAGGFYVGGGNFGANAVGGKTVTYPVTLLDSTVTGNVDLYYPTKANTYGNFNT